MITRISLLNSTTCSNNNTGTVVTFDSIDLHAISTVLKHKKQTDLLNTEKAQNDVSTYELFISNKFSYVRILALYKVHKQRHLLIVHVFSNYYLKLCCCLVLERRYFIISQMI